MDADNDDGDDYVAPNGLSSRRRMHDSYRIMQANNVERESGSEEAIISVSRSPSIVILTTRFLQVSFSFHMPSCCNFSWVNSVMRVAYRHSCIERGGFGASACNRSIDQFNGNKTQLTTSVFHSARCSHSSASESVSNALRMDYR